MRNVNRFSVMLWIFAIILASCIFRANAYANAVIILVSVFAMMLGYCHIEKNMNEKEQRFINKLDTFI